MLTWLLGPPGSRRNVLLAVPTPLASILGSGFLIVVPVLERALGSLAIAGILVVCALAFAVGCSIRHNIRAVQPHLGSGRLDRGTEALDRLADLVVVVAYVISVALYIRILSQYALEYAGLHSLPREQLLSSIVIGVIGAVGVIRGFGGLTLLERIALGAGLAIAVALIADFLRLGVVSLVDGTFDLPPVVDRPIGQTALVLGGILITTQGFETVRYLGTHFSAEERIVASRFAQVAATLVYVGFVATAIPLMGIGASSGPDPSLLALIERVAPILVLPLVITALLTQLSAALADTVAAGGNLAMIGRSRIGERGAYVVACGGAIAVAWAGSLFTVITLASRAFAAYYALQAAVAMRTSERRLTRAAYGLLAILLTGVALFAEPVG